MDQINLPVKMHLDKCLSRFGRTWFGQPHLAASGHRLSLGHCLVGPDVRWSVPGLGWSVWCVWWASFACVTQEAKFYDYVCVFVVFSSYSELVLMKS